jgi:predicted phosphodiesterase
MIEKASPVYTKIGHRIKRAIGVSACAVICGAGGAVSMNTLGQTEAKLGPVTAEVGLQIDGNPHELFGFAGGTRVGLAGMDTTFDTHPFGPSVNGAIRSIDLQSTQAAIGPTVTTGQLEQNMRQQISEDLDHLERQKSEIIIRSLGAFAGGIIGSGALLEALMWASREKNQLKLRELLRNNVPLGIAGSLVVGMGSSAVAGISYDPSQFASPQKSGAVASAEILAKSSDKIRVADERNANTAVAVLAFINSIEAEAKLEEGIEQPAFRIIVISDNHMVDPSKLVNSEIKQSPTPAVVIDLGDITNFGTPNENTAAKKWYERIKASVYLAPGNHDDDETPEKIGEVPTVNVVGKGQIASFNIGGERVLAIGDPLYTPSPSVPPTESELNQLEEMRETARKLIEDADDNGEPYDIIITHEPNFLDDIDVHGAGVLEGHTHKQETEFNEEGWVINPGTTGGAGLRRFQAVTQDSDNETAPRSYTVLSIVPNCQLSEVKEVSYRAAGSDDTYSVTQRINPNYDPELDGSTRCL